MDWNDFGIDPRPASSVVAGAPVDWFAPYGWRVTGTERGSEWEPVTRAVLEAACGDNPEGVPSMAWFRTRKGRGYGKQDAASHGSPWPMNSAEFWATRHQFMARYGVEYTGVDAPAPADAAEVRGQAEANLRAALDVLRRDDALVGWLSDRLLALAESVPEHIDGFRLDGTTAGIFTDRRLFDVHGYPVGMWKQPGEKAPNRAALGAWGAYVNAVARRDYGRPLFIAASADLAESTNIAGFAQDCGELPGFGWYERSSNPRGALLPTEITEFTNAGLLAGMASVNLAADPFTGFDGFWGACSTYGSFSYLKYGPMRLFSQLAQDCDLRVGRLLWIAGHSGPETAEDSRTHFGIFETGVTQLFPEGQVIDLHPWEYNEVPVVLAAAFASQVPIVVLHLTRPAIEIPDRVALGIPSHLAAARGAYVLRPFRDGPPRRARSTSGARWPPTTFSACCPTWTGWSSTSRWWRRSAPSCSRPRTGPTGRASSAPPTVWTPWWSPTAPSPSCATGPAAPGCASTRSPPTGTTAGAPVGRSRRSSRKPISTPATSSRRSSGSPSSARSGWARSGMSSNSVLGR